MGLLVHPGAAPGRRRVDVAWPAAERSSEHKRARARGHVLLLALVGCVLVSMISFNASSSTRHAARTLNRDGQPHAGGVVLLQPQQATAGSSVIAGKRHRKLEHGVQADDGQVALAAMEIDIPLATDADAALAAATAVAAAAGIDGGSVDSTTASAAILGGAQEGALQPILGSMAQTQEEEEEEEEEALALDLGGDGALNGGLSGLSAAEPEGGEGGGSASAAGTSDGLPQNEEGAEDLEGMQLRDELARREQAEQAADAAWDAARSAQGGAEDDMENPDQPAGGAASTAGGAGTRGGGSDGSLSSAAAGQQIAAAVGHPQSQQAEQFPDSSPQSAQQQQQQQETGGEQQQQQQRQETEEVQQQAVQQQLRAQEQQQQQAQQNLGSAAAGTSMEGSAGAAAAGAAVGRAGDEAAGPATAAGRPRRRKSPYHQALQKCDSLACLKEAALTKERHPGQFRFPHFFVIGWQKCATTSLFHHLVLHPGVQCPSVKEPEFFTNDCQYDPQNCPLDKQRVYIQETLHINRVLRHNAYRAMFEGSTHYGREGPRIAKGLRQVFPWVKLIASMREPISRGISMLAHNLDKSSIGCLKRRDIFSCLQRGLPALNYTTPLTAWLEAFPREQIMLLQYESLTNPEYTAAHLHAVKTFLELDPSLPATGLQHSNSREGRLGKPSEGWPMTRRQYESLVQLVRPDAERVAALVTQHGLGDGKRWMANWEKAWQANFNSCNLEDQCVIQLS